MDYPRNKNRNSYKDYLGREGTSQHSDHQRNYRQSYSSGKRKSNKRSLSSRLRRDEISRHKRKRSKHTQSTMVIPSSHNPPPAEKQHQSRIPENIRYLGGSFQESSRKPDSNRKTSTKSKQYHVTHSKPSNNNPKISQPWNEFLEDILIGDEITNITKTYDEETNIVTEISSKNSGKPKSRSMQTISSSSSTQEKAETDKATAHQSTKISCVPLESLLEINPDKSPARSEENPIYKNVDSFSRRIMEQVVNMDKISIKKIINNPTGKYDAGLQICAQKRLREEIRQKLKEIASKRINNGFSGSSSFEFFNFFSDSCPITEDILHQINQAFGINLFNLSSLNEVPSAEAVDNISSLSMDKIQPDSDENRIPMKVFPTAVGNNSSNEPPTDIYCTNIINLDENVTKTTCFIEDTESEDINRPADQCVNIMNLHKNATKLTCSIADKESEDINQPAEHDSSIIKVENFIELPEALSPAIPSSNKHKKFNEEFIIRRFRNVVFPLLSEYKKKMYAEKLKKDPHNLIVYIYKTCCTCLNINQSYKKRRWLNKCLQSNNAKLVQKYILDLICKIEENKRKDKCRKILDSLALSTTASKEIELLPINTNKKEDILEDNSSPTIKENELVCNTMSDNVEPENIVNIDKEPYEKEVREHNLDDTVREKDRLGNDQVRQENASKELQASVIKSYCTSIENDINSSVIEKLKEIDAKLEDLINKKYFTEKEILRLQREQITMELSVKQLQKEKLQLLCLYNNLEDENMMNLRSALMAIGKNKNEEQDQIINVSSPGETKTNPGLEVQEPTSSGITLNSEKSQQESATEAVEIIEIPDEPVTPINNVENSSEEESLKSDSTLQFKSKNFLKSLIKDILNSKKLCKKSEEGNSSLLLSSISSSYNEIGNGPFEDGKDPVTMIKIHSDFAIAASNNGHLSLFCLKDRKLISKFTKHLEKITGLFIDDGDFVYSTSHDGYLRKTSIENFGLEIQSINIQEPLRVLDVEWNWAFLGGRWGNVFVCNLKSNNPKEKLLCSIGSTITALKATREGPRRLLIVASKGNKINIRDASSGLLLRTMDVKIDLIIEAILLDEDLIRFSCNNNEIYNYNYHTGNKENDEINIKDEIVSVKLLRSKHIIAGCSNGSFYVYQESKLIKKLTFTTKHLITFEIFGKKIIISFHDSTMEIFDLPDFVNDL